MTTPTPGERPESDAPFSLDKALNEHGGRAMTRVGRLVTNLREWPTYLSGVLDQRLMYWHRNGFTDHISLDHNPRDLRNLTPEEAASLGLTPSTEEAVRPEIDTSRTPSPAHEQMRAALGRAKYVLELEDTFPDFRRVAIEGINELLASVPEPASDPATAPGHTDLMVPPETIDAWLEENPLPAPDSASPDMVREALEPFAKLCDEIEFCMGPNGHPDNWAKACTWPDLIRARKVYRSFTSLPAARADGAEAVARLPVAWRTRTQVGDDCFAYTDRPSKFYEWQSEGRATERLYAAPSPDTAAIERCAEIAEQTAAYSQCDLAMQERIVSAIRALLPKETRP
jgi:hypothetical protein